MASIGALDHALCQELGQLVEKITTTGLPNLPVDSMKELKKICKKSDGYVKHCFHHILTQLDKDHCEIRLSAFQIAHELFMRSHCFREILLADFQTVMELTLEIDPDFPLPPPKKAAKALRSQAIASIHEWREKFGDDYKKLDLGYNFLKTCKKVNFQDIHASTVQEARMEEERNSRQASQHREKVGKTIEEMNENVAEIQNCITQAKNCLSLLLPTPDAFQINGLSSPPLFSRGDPWKLPDDLSSSNQELTSKDDNAGEKCNTAELDVNSGDSKGHATEPRSMSSVKKGMKCKSGRRKSRDTTLPGGGECQMCGETLPKTTKDINQVQDQTGDSQHESSSRDGYVSPGATGTPLPLGQGSTENAKSADDTRSAPAQTPTDSTDERKTDINNDLPAASLGKVAAQTETDGSDKYDSSDDDDFVGVSGADSNDEEEACAGTSADRLHGRRSQMYSLTVDVLPDRIHIQESPDNVDILYNLKDSVRLINHKFVPSIQKWLEVFAKYGGDQEQVKKALDLKVALLRTLEKIGKLRVTKAPKVPSVGDVTARRTSSVSRPEGDEDDDDFEEVPAKEGFEPRIPDHLREEYGLVDAPPKPGTSQEWCLKEMMSTAEDDPTTWQSTVKRLIQQRNVDPVSQGTEEPPGDVSIKQATEVSGTKQKLLKVAPLMPYGTDLLHWGEKIEPPTLQRFDSEHRFWTAKDNDVKIDENALASMKSRMITFAGNFEPVKWKCRAPLPSGTLCERMDREKCPFHGRVVPRNNMGNPINPEDILKLEKEAEKKQRERRPEWEDPALQADIMAATGVDLSRKGKGRGKGKGKRRKFPNLTDLKEVKDSRTRLQTRVLSSDALKRVAAAMDATDQKRFKDKFGNNFNYTFSSK